MKFLNMTKTLLISLLIACSHTVSALSLSPVVVENQVLTIASIGTQDYEVSQNAELRISNPVASSTGVINITSETGWVFLDAVLPSQAIASFLTNFRVNGQAAINKTNIRVTNHLRGCVIMAHGISYKPLTVYKEENFQGGEMSLSQYTYHKKAQLGSFDDAISSFKLKRGYMATFAMNEDGTRFSKVYIADNADVNISLLPNGLNNQVSFIRVLPWRYTGKKGIGFGDITAARTINADWYYSWGPQSTADLTDIEFVPMKWNARTVNDANWNTIMEHKDVTHVLGYNEPDGAEQANMTVDKQIELWPKMLESGLRVGAPAVAGKYEQLYEFIDRCDALNYRVDFVPVHIYREVSAQTFYNQIKGVYDRTKRPIWITEFNYGGDWTSGNPSLTTVRDRIRDIIQMFDTARIVERYAIFDFDNWDRSRYVFTNPTSNYILSPMGEMYRDNVSPMAFKSALEIFKPYKLIPPTNIKAVSEGARIVNLSWINDGLTQSVTVERAPKGTTNYSVLAILQGDAQSYQDKVPYSGAFVYRIKTLNIAGETSPYGTIEINVVENYNVALNKNATASSVLSGYPASFAVDGDTASAGSRWVNVRNVFPCNLTVGLQGRYSIKELKLFTGYLGYNTPLTNFNFQYWNGNEWVNIVSETNNTNPKYSKKFEAVETDSVRLLINAVADGIVRLYEMQVMGSIVLNTSIDNPTASVSKLQVYPNPANNSLYFSNFDATKNIEVFDMQGRLLLKSQILNEVDISHLNKGIYILKADDGQIIRFVKD
jgi:hypothetical protein